MARSKSSSRWLREHFSDPYVKRAQAEGWRSRAVFKLEELIERDRLLKPGMVIVDLGAAPGGWSQVARERLAVVRSKPRFERRLEFRPMRAAAAVVGETRVVGEIGHAQVRAELRELAVVAHGQEDRCAARCVAVVRRDVRVRVAAALRRAAIAEIVR